MLGVDRAEELLGLLADEVSPMEVMLAEDGVIAADGKINSFGDIKHLSGESNIAGIERTAAQARDDTRPNILLGIQRAGTTIVVQHGRETLLRPGELIFMESTAPFTFADPDGIRNHFFRIPIDRLALPRNLISQLSAVTLGPGHPVADLASAYFQRLGAHPEVYQGSGGEAISSSSIELTRALIATHLDAMELGKDAMHATLQLRVLEYVRAHLHDPNLSSAQVAAEHHISVRQLYKVLAAGDIMLGDWIRSERLAGSLRDLSGPLAHTTSIAAVARRWGFSDASSFARIFRSAYGVSPRQWRETPHLGREGQVSG
ncbi:helix-turn-helix domain-containing protein [soil metagenome]